MSKRVFGGHSIRGYGGSSPQRRSEPRRATEYSEGTSLFISGLGRVETRKSASSSCRVATSTYAPLGKYLPRCFVNLRASRQVLTAKEIGCSVNLRASRQGGDAQKCVFVLPRCNVNLRASR